MEYQQRQEEWERKKNMSNLGPVFAATSHGDQHYCFGGLHAQK